MTVNEHNFSIRLLITSIGTGVIYCFKNQLMTLNECNLLIQLLSVGDSWA